MFCPTLFGVKTLLKLDPVGCARLKGLNTNYVIGEAFSLTEKAAT